MQPTTAFIGIPKCFDDGKKKVTLLESKWKSPENIMEIL